MSFQDIDYYYDQQIRRYITQFMRIFSGFHVKESSQGADFFNRVPVRYASFNRMVSHILKNNSENTVNSTPFFSCNIQNLEIDRNRARDPYNVDRSQITERFYDEITGAYTSDPGNLYTVERYMPVPYNLTMQVDLWTSNIDQKLQLWEQLLVLFNPSIQLQSNTNPLDWTNIFEVTLTGTQFTNRTQPAGVDDVIDVATFTFEIPIWLSPPAKVKRQKIINTIVTNIQMQDDLVDLNFNNDYYDFFNGIADDATIIVTPNNYFVRILGDRVNNYTATLLGDNGTELGDWELLLQMLSPTDDAVGTVANANITGFPITVSSTIQLNHDGDREDSNSYITGTISKTANSSVLSVVLDLDTLPNNTLANVISAVDPSVSYPGDGTLPVASNGQRYLLSNDTAGNVWNVSAGTNDIVEYNGNAWVVSFDSVVNGVANSTVQYINLGNEQYEWTGSDWIETVQGTYKPGYWRLNL